MAHPLKRPVTVAAALTFAFTATACSSKATEGQSGTEDGVRTGPGVTADTITLGAMSDLTKVYGPLGKTLVAGNQLYAENINAAGGICGRQLQVEVRDHAHDVQTATTQFAELEPKVAAFVQLLGSPMVASLQPQLEAKNAVTIPATWSTDWLNKPGLVLVGGSYANDIINGLDYLISEGRLTQGDTIGHIGFKGDFGSNAITGSTYAAQELGLMLEPVEIAPSATDLTAQTNTLINAGVKAILISAGPKQTASAAAVADAAGLDVPILANGPAFDPTLLDTPVGAALEKNLHIVTSYEPYAADSEGAQKIQAAYEKANADGGAPTMYVNYGYASAQVLGNALQVACENEDLSREGIQNALRSLDSVDTAGVMPTLDLTKSDVFPTNETIVSVPDKATPGGLKVVKPQFVSDIAKGFTG